MTDSRLSRTHLPSQEAYASRIAETTAASVPHFPRSLTAPDGAPNVVVVLLDDVGFGQPSAFGGPVDMPNLDALAGRGLRYNRFHTAAMCSPTRAALLTGRNHHQIANGAVAEMATGYPGYSTIWPRSAASVAEVLRLNGYSTAALGKWHNTPEWEINPNGPFDRWPTGLGFEMFYGFMGADANQWEPTLYRNTTPIDTPYTPEEGYHLDRDLADQAISWVRLQRSVAAHRPFFLYWAPGTAHTPHHAPREWIQKYAGRFDAGWDRIRQETFQRQLELGIIPADSQISERPKEITAWDSLSDDEHRLYARYMEAFAGALSHFDHQFGRFVAALEELGEHDNTLIIFVAGDNGPAAEGTPTGQFNKWSVINSLPEDQAENLRRIDEIGSPTSYNNYPVGWAWAGATPFPWFKQIASHLGGTRNGMVLSWPARVSARGDRSHFGHVVDLTPTILDAIGIPRPEAVHGAEQLPFAGISLLPSVDDEAGSWAPPRTQYFEILGNRGVYQDGWMASARHGRLPWQYTGGSTGIFEHDRWELYDLSSDYAQSRDLSAAQPGRLEELRKVWDQEARDNFVYPLDDSLGERLAVDHKPNPGNARRSFTYYPGAVRIPEGSAPNVKGRSHRITARVTHGAGDRGLLLSAGGRFAGYSLFVDENRLIYAHNVAGRATFEFVSGVELPGGEHTLCLDFVTHRPVLGSGGTVRLLVDGTEVVVGDLPQTVPYRYSYAETFNVGRDSGTPVSSRYSGAFEYSGVIRRVDVEILSELGAVESGHEKSKALELEIESH
ncbi:arylsulfatase [Streptosporangium sp. NBC_01755]|uniref:arylsulfatase n=1 Tax=unclassified Streptosporangium TaxID=2632669 RepID=UPI002DD98398|nr:MULTISPECIES: arylsulfatase [unclassified Streptosporangium]WSA28207.1 arylsulfatase [Streptosporangium sp. NBC_01810]WSD00316.1 arylsulfatase [Streptosporangium sp. NBC_01755]